MKLFNKMYYLVLVLAVVFTLNNCSTDQISPQNEEGISNNFAAKQGNSENGVINRVTMGGNDICEAWLGLNPGCDGNYSLIAIEKADGTIMGQWHDTWAGGGNGIHVEIDCMNVEGNSAIVGGYVKHGSYDGFDLTGWYFVTKVVDNGTSQHDPADQACFTIDSPIESCQDQEVDFGGYTTLYEALNDNLYDITHGQVEVW